MGESRVKTVFLILAVIFVFLTVYNLVWAFEIGNSAPIMVIFMYWLIYFVLLGIVMLTRFFRRKAAKE